jgi:sulfonate transport system substrate-binding protein
MSTTSARPRLRWLLAVTAVALAACGTDDSSSDTTSNAAATTEAPTTVAAADTTAPDASAPATDAPTTTVGVPEVPAGTTLRVGDQSSTLQLPLETSGQIDQVQAELEYSTFVGGPPLIEAFNAGAIDVGYVGDTPPILALARQQDIVVVGAWRFSGNLIALVVPPGKDVASVADLKGKKVAYPTGTALQAFAISALDEAGLTPDDITQVDVSVLDVLGALQSGDVDAGVVVEPILSSYLDSTPDATVIRDGEGLTTGLQLIITTRATLDDPAKAAAIGDFILNEAKAFKWNIDNQEAAAQAFADANDITLEAAQALQARNGTQLFVPLDDGVLEPLQSLADLFFSAGAIPGELDVTELIDDRFNPLIELANAG